MKRVISLLLAMIMSLSMLVGCGGKEDLPDGEVVLKVGIPQNSTISNYSNNGFTKYLQEKSGLEIKFVFFSNSRDEYIKQLALMCSAQQELPDVLLGFDLGHYIVNQYGEDGYFLDLTEYIDEYGANYKTAIEKLKKDDPEVAEYITSKGINTNNDAVYGLPRVICTASDDVQSLMHINKNWLDKLGLQMPTTLDELRNVLQAFATKDPNGNGKNDELAMLGTSGIQNYIINSFVHYDEGTFNVTDGKVWDPIKTDEFRQAVIYGNELVKDGLYSSLSFTVTNNTEFKSVISPADEPSKVGIFCGLSTVMTNPASEAIGEFAVLPALSDGTGKGGYTVINERNISWTGFISKDCEYPAVAMKFMDLFYDDETIMRQRHGVKDEDWVYQEGSNGAGTTSCVKVIDSEAFFNGDSTWGVNVLGIMTHLNYLTVADDPETERIAQTQRLVKETWDIINAAKQAEERCIYLVYTQEEYEVREEKASLVNEYISSNVTNFFAGEKDPSNDAVWNEFIETLDEIGRAELMQVAQDAYDRK